MDKVDAYLAAADSATGASGTVGACTRAFDVLFEAGRPLAAVAVLSRAARDRSSLSGIAARQIIADKLTAVVDRLDGDDVALAAAAVEAESLGVPLPAGAHEAVAGARM